MIGLGNARLCVCFLYCIQKASLHLNCGHRQSITQQWGQYYIFRYHNVMHLPLVASHQCTTVILCSIEHKSTTELTRSAIISYTRPPELCVFWGSRYATRSVIAGVETSNVHTLGVLVAWSLKKTGWQISTRNFQLTNWLVVCMTDWLSLIRESQFRAKIKSYKEVKPDVHVQKVPYWLTDLVTRDTSRTWATASFPGSLLLLYIHYVQKAGENPGKGAKEGS